MSQRLVELERAIEALAARVAALEAERTPAQVVVEADALFEPIARAAPTCTLCGGSGTDACGWVCHGCDGAGRVPT